MQVDSKQARSFANDTCPNSKIRGSFDLREDWVEEVRNLEHVKTVDVASENNLADLFIKCLARGVYLRLKEPYLR